MSQIKEKKFFILMDILKLSKINGDIKLGKKGKQKFIHIPLKSNNTLYYDIYIYNSYSKTLDEVFYIETNKDQNIKFLRKMEQLCKNCKKFEALEYYMKDDSSLFIYSTHHTIRDFTSLLSRSRSPSTSPTQSCWGCFQRTRSTSRGGKRKKTSKTKKIYR
jgi:hypothetical protein